MMGARYNIMTWDADSEQYTEQDGMTAPCLGVTFWGMLGALRELRGFGYGCYRDDAAVFVERTDDRFLDQLRLEAKAVRTAATGESDSSSEDKERLHSMTEPVFGKKSAGRLLDGREWNEMPVTAAKAVFDRQPAASRTAGRASG